MDGQGSRSSPSLGLQDLVAPPLVVCLLHKAAALGHEALYAGVCIRLWLSGIRQLDGCFRHG